MKKTILWSILVSTLYANTKSDVILTFDYNKLDDPGILYKSKILKGIRAGIYQDETIGFQVGFEQTNHANCQNLHLKRFYTNALIMKKLQNKFTPYAIGTFGYETSSKQYRESQVFVGLGGGIKYNITNTFNLFLETRALKSLKTQDLTIATTFGLGYTFGTGTTKIENKKSSKPIQKKKTTVLKPRIKPHKNYKRTKMVYIEKPSIITKPNIHYQGSYYIQIAALTTSSPKPLLKKLHSHGIQNVSIKKQNRDGVIFSFIIVGPYHDRITATNALPRVRIFSPQAFIKKF